MATQTNQPPPSKKAASPKTFLSLPRELRQQILLLSNPHLLPPPFSNIPPVPSDTNTPTGSRHDGTTFERKIAIALRKMAIFRRQMKLFVYYTNTEEWSASLCTITEIADDLLFVKMKWSEDHQRMVREGEHLWNAG
ncbi:hypothetical protein EG327_005084 [Venturia inaequalis]|uniref:Uncharacterized protein n=1 Tax=Venturia inaequalis TaxID=5025 RepID=A0A8H3VAC1_VENIN|nr:hypothetical protein EG327_005084 [Venturia inaequalis]